MNAPALDNVIEILTPENIKVEYRVAGPATRLGAYLIDVIICLLFCVLLAFLNSWTLGQISDGFSIGVLLAGSFIISWGYWIGSETFFSGRTLGKKILGIRVLSEDGTPVTFSQVFIRNILRAVDSQPLFFYQFGFWCSICTLRFQRLGDVAAGTVVVYEERKWFTAGLINRHSEVCRVAGYFPPDFNISQALGRVLALYMSRRSELSHMRRRVLAGPLAMRVCKRYGLPVEITPDLVLCAMYYRFMTHGKNDQSSVIESSDYVLDPLYTMSDWERKSPVDPVIRVGGSEESPLPGESLPRSSETSFQGVEK